MADELTVNQLTVLSDLFSRAQMAARMNTAFNGLRDYNQTFGYAPILDFDDYWNWYKRGGIAKRIIDLPCDATWRHDPEVVDDENPHEENQFERAWKELNRKHALIARLHRADVLQSIGRYAVMLLGTRDGEMLAQPIHDGQFRRPEDLLYTQVLSEKHAEIVALEDDPKSPRYGLPKIYNVSLGNNDIKTAAVMTRVVPVHHSRIIHFAEGLLEDDIVGTPRLESVMNLLMDLLKVSGGGAETYWLNASNKVKVETQDGFKLTPTDVGALKEMVTDFTHQLSPFMLLNGMRADRLGIQIADPTGNYSVIMQQIAGTVGIPQRLLTGTESGEQASTQDRQNWAESVMSRQKRHAEPGMLRVVVSRLIDLGILPQPTQNEYVVKWKNLLELDDLQRAQLALARAQAASHFVSGSAEMVFAPSEFRESMGFDAEMPEEAKASIEDMRENESEVDEEDPEVREQFERTKRVAA